MTSMAASDELVGTAKGSHHPGGLYVLFGAEMWERFSYYGMRALLTLYLTKHLGMERADALDIYAIYTGLVYLTPLLGGYLADKVLGQRKAILIGGTVMALGHFAMAFEPLLHLALGLLILGNGFFKPNISTMVGQLYPQGDPRRDGAYTIFYMGINLGAFFSPLVCGTLGEQVGWHYGFGAAGVGMVFGLISFVAFQRLLVGGYPPGREAAGPPRLAAADWVHVTLISLACLGVAYAATAPAVTSALGRIVPASPRMAFLAYYLVLALGLGLVIVATGRVFGPRGRDNSQSPERTPAPVAAPNSSYPAPAAPRHGRPEAKGDEPQEDPRAPFTAAQWQRIAVILIVAIFSIVFWMGFEQAGGTLTLFADEKTDRVVLGRPFPASWFQSVNPFLIFLLAPLFSMLWTALDRTRLRISSAAKMGIGLLLLGFGFMVMAQADRGVAAAGKVGPQW
ncbi:MAG TPA: oligopeptide:H+ symporter, partial [Isosphaeraceae bacterium]